MKLLSFEHAGRASWGVVVGDHVAVPVDTVKAKRSTDLRRSANTDADPRSGAVTIRYRTLDQLDLICQRLTGGGI